MNNKSKSRQYNVNKDLNCENKGKLTTMPFDNHLSRCAAGEFVTMTNVFDQTSSHMKAAARRIGDDNCKVYGD